MWDEPEKDALKAIRDCSSIAGETVALPNVLALIGIESPTPVQKEGRPKTFLEATHVHWVKDSTSSDTTRRTPDV